MTSKTLRKVVSGRVYIASPKAKHVQAYTEFRQLRSNFRTIIWQSWVDIKARYRRSVIGPFWISLGTLTFVIGYSILSGVLFRRPVAEFLGFIAAGVVSWQFIVLCLSEGAKAFIAAKPEIDSVKSNMLSFPVRVVVKGLIGFAHSLPIVLLAVGFTVGLSFHLIFAFLGLLVVVFTMLPIIAAIGILTARFRDLEQMIVMIVQFMFYMTPIIWKPDLVLETPAHWLLHLNPFYYLVTVIRSPLLGEAVPLYVWGCAGVLMLLANILGGTVYYQFRRRIPFWI